MVKYLSCILCFYTLVLGLIPCCDYELQQNEDNMEISHNQKHEHEGLDLCSPFCTCQCCKVSATQIQLEIIELEPPKIKMSKQKFFYLDDNGRDFTFSLLQPPIA